MSSTSSQPCSLSQRRPAPRIHAYLSCYVDTFVIDMMKSEATEQNHSLLGGNYDEPFDGDSHPRNLLLAPIQPQSQEGNSSSTPLRRVKWTPEEETYALAEIHNFNSGYQDASPGITLRSYLSEKLQCNPMRITKKFTGDASIGKKVIRFSCALSTV